VSMPEVRSVAEALLGLYARAGARA